MVCYWSHLPRIRIMADYAAEIEFRSDGEAEHEEIRSYDRRYAMMRCKTT